MTHYITQKERRNLDRGWLAGIIDGEGCFQIAKQKLSQNKNRTNNTEFIYRAQVIISNNNPNLINKILRIFKENELHCYVTKRGKKCEGMVERYQLQIAGTKRIKLLLDYLGSELIVKTKQFGIIQEFVQHRLTIVRLARRRGISSFGKIDLNLYKKMKTANLEYKSNLEGNGYL